MRTSLSCDLHLQVEPAGLHEGGRGSIGMACTTEHSVLPLSGELYEIQLEDIEVHLEVN